METLGVQQCWQRQLFSFSCVETSTPTRRPISILRPRCWWYQNSSGDSMVYKIFVLHCRYYLQHIRRAWHAPIANSVLGTIFVSAVTDVDYARLKAALTLHSGNWIHTPQIASLKLNLTDDEIIISVAIRRGIRACSPHNCVYGRLVDARCLHGL